MTHEERLAVAIWNLREWGVHPSWIEHWKRTESEVELIRIAEFHQSKHPHDAPETISDRYKKLVSRS